MSPSRKLALLGAILGAGAIACGSGVRPPVTPAEGARASASSSSQPAASDDGVLHESVSSVPAPSSAPPGVSGASSGPASLSSDRRLSAAPGGSGASSGPASPSSDRASSALQGASGEHTGATTVAAVVHPAPSAPRPTTLRLSSTQGAPEDAELAAGDDSFEQGDLEQSEKHYAAARQRTPGSVAAAVGLARVRIARLHLPLDYGAAKGSRDATAIEGELARLVARAPAFGPSSIELGRCRLLLGDAPGAVRALTDGVRLLPDEPEAHSQLGVGLLATGHADKAVQELRRAAELDPGSAARHGNLGTALLMVGQTQEAIAEYEVRVNLEDGNARAHSDLGTALMGTQDMDRALTELKRAVALEPSRASFHSNLGFALQQSGRIDGALAQYREALRLDPKLVSAWINLGTALSRDPKTRKEARSAFERAGALSPGDPRVKANLDELDALDPSKAPVINRLTAPNAIP